MNKKIRIYPEYFYEEKNKPGIYIIKNVINDNFYIGQSNDIGRRWIIHLHYLRKGCKTCPILLKAYKKYGESAFKFEVIEYCEIEKLDEREQHYLDTLKPPYNVAIIANTTKGIPSKRKGQTLPEEHCKKISKALMGNKNYQYVTHEGRERHRQAVIGNTYAKGHSRVHTQQEIIKSQATRLRKSGFKLSHGRLTNFLRASKQGNPKELTPKQMIQAVDVMALLLNPVNN
jgi:group I intron endonuclease